MNSPCKYYFVDSGLRNARLNFRQTEVNHIMENVVYNELVMRGYQVDVGNIGVREREEEQFANCSKQILSRTKEVRGITFSEKNITPKNENGISIIGLKDFLLNTASLDFQLMPIIQGTILKC